MVKKFITTDFTQTQKLGLDFAKKFRGGEVIALYGDLGSGKTTFMQGLAKGLGIERNIISPTFIILRTYKTGPRTRDKGIEELHHLDLYRIENETQAVDVGLMELLNDSRNIVAIEWPDKIENMLPANRISIYFTYLGDNKRQIQFS